MLSSAAASPDDRQFVRRTAAIIAALIVFRCLLAVIVPLMCDEAYYWMWSQHLATGYYDHPPMVAVVVRIGTLIAGDTHLGIRLFSILLAAPMSWAIYRTGTILFKSVRIGAKAALLFNATMMVGVGTIITTPDVPLMVASSFILLFLAEIFVSGRGAWWIGVGVASGAALLSKYNALFSGAVILIWLATVRELRRWLLSPWLYLGGIIAIALFTPVIIWNADHQWASFIKQFGRAHFDRFAPRFLAELLGAHFLFVTPAVFLLSTSGLYVLAKNWRLNPAASVLIQVSIWTVFGYFCVHALHDSVHPDWLCQLYPALAIAAAVATEHAGWPPMWQSVLRWSDRWALPTSLLLTALLVIQVQTGILTGYRRDESARVMGVGIQAVADRLAALRDSTGATCILTTDYITTAWLAFYSPRGSCVAQYNERIRWVSTPEPDAALLKGKLLFVATDGAIANYALASKFGNVEGLGRLARMRGPTAIQTYDVALVSGARGAVFDPVMP